jgi:hypothetical protein
MAFKFAIKAHGSSHVPEGISAQNVPEGSAPDYFKVSLGQSKIQLVVQ